MRARLVLVVAVLICTAAICSAQKDGWTFELFGGSAYNLPTPLVINQTGEEQISLTADYTTKPFVEAPYYAFRIGKWKDGKAWEFEEVHHKLYLDDDALIAETGTAGDHFEVTHGYNFFTLNRAWEKNGLVYRIGAGLVVTHPETTIRGKTFMNLDGGILGFDFFIISGLTAQAAVEKKFYVAEDLFVALEAKLSGSVANVPIVDGHARMPNVSIHGLFGVGYDF